MSLHAKIAEHLDNHLSGLIDGDRLRRSEISHWIELLLMAEEHRTPVKRARFFGFTFITRTAHIRQTIDYLTYH